MNDASESTSRRLVYAHRSRRFIFIPRGNHLSALPPVALKPWLALTRTIAMEEKVDLPAFLVARGSVENNMGVEQGNRIKKHE
jgi:hypothetical protein